MRVLFWLIVAVLTLVQFRYVGENTAFYFNGMTVAWVAGVLLTVALAVMLFSRVQALLLVRGLIDRRVRTPYDVFPLLLLIPFFIGFSFGGSDVPANPGAEHAGQWMFTWGGHQMAVVFLAMLGLIYLYRIVRLLDLVLAKQKARTRS